MTGRAATRRVFEDARTEHRAGAVAGVHRRHFDRGDLLRRVGGPLWIPKPPGWDRGVVGRAGPSGSEGAFENPGVTAAVAE
jgi:hypothetical protein